MFTLPSLVATSTILASNHIIDTLPNSVAVPSQFRDVPTAIGTIFNFVIVIAGTIFVILILIGGIQYLTSAGNEEGTGKAKRLMVDAIVGLILTLAAWAIGIFILQQVGLTRRGFFIGSPPVIPPISNPGPGLPPIGPANPPGNPTPTTSYDLGYQDGYNLRGQHSNADAAFATWSLTETYLSYKNNSEFVSASYRSGFNDGFIARYGAP